MSDAKNKLLIAADTGDVNDTKALAVMVEKAQQNLGQLEENTKMNVLADKGYHSGRELKACEELNVTTFVSPKESSSKISNPKFAMESFEYDNVNDTYKCPAGEILKTNGRWYNKTSTKGRKSYNVKHYKTKACSECKLRTECTKNKNGRFIERTEYQPYVSKNNDRVNQNPDYYRQRQQIIEHQFGTLKRHWHFDYTLTRGKEKVMGEVYLIFTCYNLKRIMSIFGFSLLMSMIKAYLSLLFVNLTSFIANMSYLKPFEDILINTYTKTKNQSNYSII